MTNSVAKKHTRLSVPFLSIGYWLQTRTNPIAAILCFFGIANGHPHIQTRLFYQIHNVSVRHSSNVDPIDGYDSVTHFQLTTTVCWTPRYQFT